jgi:photosystem II stability/assembly factor-like uncharacterized protein
MPDPAIQRALRRLSFPDLARVRETFRRRQQRDEQGLIPLGALLNAVSELDSTRHRTSTAPNVAGVPTGGRVRPSALLPGLAGLHDRAGWTSIGPGNIGGRTRSVLIHPTNPRLLFAGSVAGGIWRSDNGGDTWEPVDDFMANLAVSCIVMDPNNPDLMYAGTGEGFFNLDSIRGAGIFRCLDGTTWQQIPSTRGPEFQNVNRLALSSDGTVLLAATGYGLLRSDDPDRLVWTKALTIGMADVKCHPTNAQRAVAGGLSNGEAYYTLDGGLTWKAATHATPWEGRVELAYARRRPATVYASVNVRSGEIWRSTNSGTSFTRRGSLNIDGDSANYLGDQGWYDNVLWASDPTNSNLLIVGGVDLWRSTDGGNTLHDISSWWDDQSAHADQHCIIADPGYDGTTNRIVYFGNDGGIYKTNDVATVGNDAQPPRVSGWIELVNTYGVTQFYGGAGNSASGTIIGGAQDNGTLRYTPASGTEGWTSMFGGDGGWCAADPTDQQYFYGEYVFLNIHRSSDGGQSSEYISGMFWNGNDYVWKPLPYRIPDAKNGTALFIAPFIMDPNQPNRLLAGGASLWRTNDAKRPNTTSTGPAWASIKNNIGSYITAIAVAPGASDVIWVGHENGQLYRTLNGTAPGPIWQRMDSQGPKPVSTGRYCTGLTVDPGSSDTVYVSFGGYVRGNVWKTTDGGATWSNLGMALPEAPARAITVHPTKSNLVYTGTEVGLFASEDGGATWSPTNEGPTNCSVEDLFWMGTVLVCVTHGRGMFEIDLANA